MADWDGEGYGQISDLQRTMARRSLSELTLRGDEDCLDVGCGDGYVSRLVAQLVPRGSVLGVDASPRMIETARSRPVPEGAALGFQAGDAAALTFADRFDLVYSFNTLHWIHDQVAALSGMARAVHPDGLVVVRYVCAGPRPSVEQVAMDVCLNPGWHGRFEGFEAPFRHIDPEGYRELAGAAGLDVRRLQVTDEAWDFGSRDAFSRWCTVGFADWTARLDAADVPAWVAEVVDNYEQVAGRPGLFRFLQLTAELTPTA